METETIEAIRASYPGFEDEEYYVIIPADCDYHLTGEEQPRTHNFDLSFDEDSILEQDGAVNNGDLHDGDFDSGLFVETIETIEYEVETYESEFEQAAYEFAEDVVGEVESVNMYDSDIIPDARIYIDELNPDIMSEAFERFQHVSGRRLDNNSDRMFVEGLNE